MKGKYISYSQDELNFLKDNERLPRGELTKLFNAKFNRNISVQNIKAKCLRIGLKTGRTGRFEKGHIPVNKGKHYDPGGRSHLTRFKKGRVPHNAKPLGYERLTKDGYTMVLVDEVNPHTGYKHRFVLKHRHIWEKANGKIPDKHVLVFKDGNKQNCELDNLVLVSQYENALMNQMHHKQANDEVKPVIRNIAKLQTSAFKKLREINK